MPHTDAALLLRRRLLCRRRADDIIFMLHARCCRLMPRAAERACRRHAGALVRRRALFCCGADAAITPLPRVAMPRVHAAACAAAIDPEGAVTPRRLHKSVYVCAIFWQRQRHTVCRYGGGRRSPGGVLILDYAAAMPLCAAPRHFVFARYAPSCRHKPPCRRAVITPCRH